MIKEKLIKNQYFASSVEGIASKIDLDKTKLVGEGLAKVSTALSLVYGSIGLLVFFVDSSVSLSGAIESVSPSLYTTGLGFVVGASIYFLSDFIDKCDVLIKKEKTPRSPTMGCGGR